MSDAGSGGENPEQLPDEAVEAKKTAARRRFLTGGALALPVIISARRNAFAYHGVRATGKSVCVSIGGTIGSKVKKNKPSVWCYVSTTKW